MPHAPSAGAPAATTTAEATVASLIAHGIDTLYAVPGVHNDPLFDALWHAQDRIRTVHTRHEQGAAYMALGAALATGRPQTFAVVPGPGMLNTSAALLTAYSMGAPVLGLIGQIPEAEIGRRCGQLHEIGDQAGILARLVDFSAQVSGPEEASRLMAEAFRAMRSGRPGPAALEIPMDVWTRERAFAASPPLPSDQPAIDEDSLRDAAKRLGEAKNPVIFVGGGAHDATDEVAALSAMLQAPVVSGFRRGRGVLSSRDPLSCPMPVGHALWKEADVVLAVGTRLFFQCRDWGVDDDLAIIHVNADPDEAARHGAPAVALVGDAAPILRALIDRVPAHNRARPSRRAEMEERHARFHEAIAKLEPQISFLKAIRDVLPDDGILVDEVTQVGFAARLAFPVYRPRTFLTPGYQDNLGWGFATALGVKDAVGSRPVISINGDGGFMYTANELATAMRHKIPLVAVVFADGAFGNVRRIQERQYGNRLIACDLANPDFVKFAESFGAAGERARTADELRGALERGLARTDGPTIVEVPVGPMPSPWQWIFLPKVRGV
ncbi:TPP-binding protein [Rhodovulum sp. PH10]|uniref:thiamine pyrophosphate-dependent enzyme n=1 Tax=Rhodovulum sp. PH10 TaxID=1187851 RepID=UPI00027C2C05|nr:thiamine pyrophosphate-dependent enzyme [Rhodovulum sp. PH10]EJW12110.1 TPP-binding protein [Rhodovulum sp. PH10]